VKFLNVQRARLADRPHRGWYACVADTPGVINTALLLPDFLLIVLGYVLARWSALERPLWDGVERLVYYLLFPCLLFVAIVRQPISFGSLASLGAAGLAITLLGIALAYALGKTPRVDAGAHAAGAQVAFRFNSYIALALAERLGGANGVAAIAVIIAVVVPLCNVAAVWPLARAGGQHYGRELLRNPLIVATVAGLVANLGGLVLPDVLATTLQRLGAAALPLGLMAVGAGLRIGALRDAPGLAAALLSIRHLVLPAVALVLVRQLPLTSLQQQIVVMFSALPTAASAYVLATRMGGRGEFAAGLVTVSTLLGMASVPVALALHQFMH
jgi:malonate transporter and related proteins